MLHYCKWEFISEHVCFLNFLLQFSYIWCNFKGNDLHAQAQDKDVCWLEIKPKQIKWTETTNMLDSSSGTMLKHPRDFIVQENGKSQEPEFA